jgi:Kdo2-lipid IVA lauroyltransferase/acyltransferase
MLTRLGVALVWLLHFLPLSLLAAVGAGVGRVAYVLAGKRRRIVATNLRLCFPELSEAGRGKLARAHFAVLGRSLIERGILWWSSKARVLSLIRFEGKEHLDAVGSQAVIVLVPHFVGMDVGWTRLSCERPLAAIYARQKNAYFEKVLLRGRIRFSDGVHLRREDGFRPAIRAMREGMPLYYLPDMDFGDQQVVFVPFFCEPAATITAVSRLARAANARVVPCVSRMFDGGAGYVVKLYPAWDNFPGPDLEADARRLNAFIEDRVREMPEQYYWVHRRFKTRPEGEGKIY